jgi:hypothetical protein
MMKRIQAANVGDGPPLSAKVATDAGSCFPFVKITPPSYGAESPFAGRPLFQIFALETGKSRHATEPNCAASAPDSPV